MISQLRRCDQRIRAPATTSRRRRMTNRSRPGFYDLRRQQDIPYFLAAWLLRWSVKNWSEREDLNLRPPVPQTGALTRLRYAPYQNSPSGPGSTFQSEATPVGLGVGYSERPPPSRSLGTLSAVRGGKNCLNRPLATRNPRLPLAHEFRVRS